MVNGRPDVLRPSGDARCGECGEAIDDEWESYRLDPADPQTLIGYFGGIVGSEPGERKTDELKAGVASRSIREFRYPEDLGVFFHRRCAPRVHRDEKRRTTKLARSLRLAITGSTLVAIQLLAIFLLLVAGIDLRAPISVLGLEIYRPWLLAALGGILGGSTRALYAFLTEICLFEMTRQGHPPVDTAHPVSGDPLRSNFDYLSVWYLYLIKVFVGGGLGFIFALLQEYGLIPFLTDNQTSREAFGIVLVAGLAGIFAEDAVGTFRGIIRGRQ